MSLYLWALKDNGYDELHVRPSTIEGNGLFSYKNIPSGTIIYRLDAQYFNDPKVSLAVIIGLYAEDVTINKDPILKFLNHSCQPNTELNKYGHLVSMDYIFAENELCIDYTPLIKNRNFEMVCLCKSEKCHQVIMGIN